MQCDYVEQKGFHVDADLAPWLPFAIFYLACSSSIRQKQDRQKCEFGLLLVSCLFWQTLQ